MFLRIVTLKLGPGRWSDGVKLAERWFAGVATLPGFVDVTFFGDEGSGEYGMYSRWTSRADAEAAGAYRPEAVQEELTRLALEPPEVRIYRVYEPRGSAHQPPQA